MTKIPPIDPEDFDLAQEIFYKLAYGESQSPPDKESPAKKMDMQQHRTSRLLALLCQRLVETGKISGADMEILVNEATR